MKKRILFSIETNDTWIIETYKSFFNCVKNQTDWEIFCTVFNSKTSESLNFNTFNIIDYKDIYEKLSITNKIFIILKNPLPLLNAFNCAVWTSPYRIVLQIYIFKKLHKLIQPDVCIVWNGTIDIRRMISTYLKKNNSTFFYAEKGLLPHSWYIDKAGINAASSLNKSTLNSYTKSSIEKEAESLDYIKNIILRGESAWKQPKKFDDINSLKSKLKIEKNKKIIFFPGQVDNDTNIIKFSNFKSIEQAIKLVATKIPKNAILLIKPHPKSSQKTIARLRLLSKNNNVRIADDINIWDLIEISDLIISINSTTLFEALLLNKKIIQLGDSILSKIGLINKEEIQTLENKILYLLSTEEIEMVESKKILQLISFLKNHYYIFSDKNHIPAAFFETIDKVEIKKNKLLNIENLHAFFQNEKNITKLSNTLKNANV